MHPLFDRLRYVGLRPGEKLFTDWLGDLRRACGGGASGELRRLLRRLIPDWHDEAAPGAPPARSDLGGGAPVGERSPARPALRVVQGG